MPLRDFALAPEREQSLLALLVRAAVASNLATSVEDAHSGYAVITAASPEAGLRISGRHRGKIDLLVTDLVMPDLSGPKLVERIAPEQPEMRVLYISGYADDEITRGGLQQGSIAFLQKPFTLPALLGKVRQVLDASKADRLQ